ncbi:hypothetical protein K3495_g13507 [Podosphaera aphanis]|nr:hypothetical protein K3495_g13507 [Podosphaera aphanis]
MKASPTNRPNHDSHLSDDSIPTSASAPVFTEANFRANPAITLLARRNHMDAEAEAEFARIGKSAHRGRRFLAVEIVRQIIYLRDTERMKAEDIEKRLGLGSQVVASLGKRGVVGVVE